MSLVLVTPKRQLKVKVKIAKLVTNLKIEFAELSPTELNELKSNPELIKYVCNLVETKIKKSDNCNKKDIVINIVSKLITITEPDKKGIGEIIEFLHSNRDIKANTFLRYIGKYIYQLVKKKVLV